MTDGGEGRRTGDGEDEEGVEEHRTEGSGRVEAESPGVGGADGVDEPTAVTASGGGPSTDGDRPPVLGEPTPAAVARIRARDSGLEHGERTAYTTGRRMLDPAVRYQWLVWTGIISLVLGSVAGGALGAAGLPPELGVVVVGLFLAAGVAWVLLRYRVWIYQVREDSLYLERGVVTHVRTIVPYVRIQHVDTSRGPLERALGLSTLVVYTAGSRGADVSVPGLKPDEARDLQGRLKELAIEAEGDDAV